MLGRLEVLAHPLGSLKCSTAPMTASCDPKAPRTHQPRACLRPIIHYDGKVVPLTVMGGKCADIGDLHHPSG